MFTRIGTTMFLLTLVGCEPTGPSLPEQSIPRQTNGENETTRRTLDRTDDVDAQFSELKEPPKAESPLTAVPPELKVRPYHEWGLRETVEDSLGRIGAPAVPPLTRLLRHPDAARRVQAANILARIGPQAAEAVPALAEALEDPDPDVRKSAARALGQIGPAADEAVGPLLRLLEQVDASPATTD